jgi:hypothetical protein
VTAIKDVDAKVIDGGRQHDFFQAICQYPNAYLPMSSRWSSNFTLRKRWHSQKACRLITVTLFGISYQEAGLYQYWNRTSPDDRHHDRQYILLFNIHIRYIRVVHTWHT